MTYEIVIYDFDAAAGAVISKTSRFAETMEHANIIATAAELDGYEAEIFEVIEND